MEWLRRLDENPVTERVIMALILVNAVTLGLRRAAARWNVTVRSSSR